MSLAEHDPRSSSWGDYYAAPARRLDRLADRCHLQVTAHHLEDCAHLEHREMVAGTPLAPAAPEQPDLLLWRGIEEPLGPKRVRRGVQARVMLHEMDAADQLDRRPIRGASD